MPDKPNVELWRTADNARRAFLEALRASGTGDDRFTTRFRIDHLEPTEYGCVKMWGPTLLRDGKLGVESHRSSGACA